MADIAQDGIFGIFELLITTSSTLLSIFSLVLVRFGFYECDKILTYKSKDYECFSPGIYFNS